MLFINTSTLMLTHLRLKLIHLERWSYASVALNYDRFSCYELMFLINRTRVAFELKLQKTNKSTDLRIPASLCTMFNVLVDAKKQTAKLCILDGGQEVGETVDI